VSKDNIQIPADPVGLIIYVNRYSFNLSSE
jgi:hypothetical protein